MAFKPGESGNPAGRPKQADLEAVDLSILRALRKVVRKNPRLLEEAIQRRLESRDNFGMIEMIAKLTRELGNKEEERTQIAIVFNGGLDPNKLKGAQVVAISTGEETGESKKLLPSAQSNFEINTDGAPSAGLVHSVQQSGSNESSSLRETSATESFVSEN